MNQLDSYQTACLAAGLLDDKKAKDIVILDISRVSVIADFFVICWTDTSTQLKAISEVVLKDLKTKYNKLPLREERDARGKWYLIDFGDVIIHIMHKEDRNFYAIEKFWSHAFVVDKEDWEKEFKKAS